MLVQEKKIGIVGGGPGGLTLARLLQMRGIQVQVYERDANREVRVQGATLDLHEESGLESLKRAGLMDAFKVNYRPDAGKVRVADKNMQVHLDDHEQEERYAEDRPEIDRGPLREILLDSLLPETVVWDRQFVNMEPEGTGWRLYFKNGTTDYADIVVAADGANSRIRPYLSDIKPIYSGVTIVEGNVYHASENAPELDAFTKGGKVFVFGEEKSLILSAKGEGSISFYTGCKVSENWVETSGIDFGDKAAVLNWFREVFGTWNPLFQELFSSDSVWFIPRPQYHFPIDQCWETQDNLTMLGDAAHRMPPYAGEGVNQAMQDAYELAASLLDEHYLTIGQAIHAFETGMCQRAAEVTEFTLANTELLHSEDAVDKMLAIMTGGV